MLDFFKFLFKKGKKAESHSPKKACKNANSCRVKEPMRNIACETDEPKCQKNDCLEKACTESASKECASEMKTEASESAVMEVNDNIESSETEVIVEARKSEPVKKPEAESATAGNGKYLIKLSSSGIYTFSLKSPKGDSIVSSGEYTLKRSCVSGIQSVRKNGVTEHIEDQTEEKIERKPNPKYEVYLSEDEKYRFKLKAPNGYVILDSQAFVSKKNCLRTIGNVRKYCSAEDVEEISKQTKTK